MTAELTMFDSAYNDQLPADLRAVAAYVDGGIGNQPNFEYAVSAFPGAQHLSIALNATDNADALDVETGAASPSDIPAWYARQKARGVHRPCIYASASTMTGDVLIVVQAKQIPRASVRLWSAHYTGSAHICGPESCGQVPAGMDGTQWTSNALGRDLDQSLLLPDFFTVPAPGNWTFGPVRKLTVVSAGPHSVKLSWYAPAVPMPFAVGFYQISVQAGGGQVGSYPRVAAKGANPQVWQGGSLSPATEYEALVRAVAADGGHASPWETVTFKTSK